MNEMNFNDDVIKAANFIIINLKLINLRTYHKC